MLQSSCLPLARVVTSPTDALADTIAGTLFTLATAVGGSIKKRGSQGAHSSRQDVVT